VALPECLWVGPLVDSWMPLTDDDLAEWFAAKGCLGITSGETGDCSMVVLGVVAVGEATTSFSSAKT